MKIPVKSLSSFEVCSEKCALFDATEAPGSLEKADLGFAVKKLTINASQTANLHVVTRAPMYAEQIAATCDLDESMSQPLWDCARARALGKCAGISNVETELL